MGLVVGVCGGVCVGGRCRGYNRTEGYRVACTTNLVAMVKQPSAATSCGVCTSGSSVIALDDRKEVQERRVVADNKVLVSYCKDTTQLVH